jgi:hypothetical protein
VIGAGGEAFSDLFGVFLACSLLHVHIWQARRGKSIEQATTCPVEEESHGAIFLEI